MLHQKFQYFYQEDRNDFSPNLKGVAQKICLLFPFEDLDGFGRKSKSKALEPSYSIQSGFFGVDISNHFWGIQIWMFFSFNFLPSWYKNSFRKLFLSTREGIEREKCSNLNFSKVVWNINTKFSSVVNFNRNLLCTTYEGSRFLRFGFPAKNV